jgi:mono/diheme cytochrome c family protein
MKTIRLAAFVITFTVFAPLAGRAADVKALWDKHCVSCHAKDGSGNTRMGKQSGAKDYRDPKVQEAMTDESALKVIKEGLTEKGKERMKPYTDKLSEEEMKALIAYIRTFKK